jgi:hypothetical protein
MEMSQGNFLCSYPKQKKMSFFFLLENQRTRGWNSTCRKSLVPVEVGRSGKGCRRVNMEQILCTHVCKWEMRHSETILGMGEGRIKENDGEDEFNMIYLIFCKNFHKCCNILLAQQ